MFARRFSLISASAIALAIGAPSARAQDAQAPDDAPQASGDGIGSSDYARVSALQGELFVKGPFDDQEQTVTLNAFLREGDELRTGADTFVELELPHSTFIRIAPQTAARIETIEGQVELDVVHGSAYLSQGPDGPDAAMVAEHGSVGTFSRTVVRFEVETGAGGYTIARVAEGSAEASCDGKFSTLSVKQTLSCTTEGPRRGEWAPDRGDAFDRWSQEREKRVRHYQAPPAQVAGQYEGMQDLDGNGDWVVVEQRYYWRPYVDVSWRPYYDGYWSWCDWLGGWTWVSSSPWGHVTHHYGRWIWLSGNGWVWSPAPVFSPAWVVWASFDGYLGWAPCDHWGRPVVVVSTHSYYDHYAWTFSRPTYFVGGGGNPRLLARNVSVRPRPFFTLGGDELRHLRARPVRDPRELMPERAHLAQRPQVVHARPLDRPHPMRLERPAANVRPWPKSSMLPRLVQEDSERKVQVHEAAASRDPIGVPRRTVRVSRDDGDGIPVATRPQRHVVARDSDDGEDRQPIERSDHSDGATDRRPAVRPSDERVDRGGGRDDRGGGRDDRGGGRDDRGDRDDRDDDDRGQVRRAQPAVREAPTDERSRQAPSYQGPSYSPSREVKPSQQRPTEQPRGFAPVRRDPPRQAQPAQSAQPQPAQRPNTQVQPAQKPQVQPQPAPAQSKPTYAPSKPSNAVKPARPDKGAKNKKGR